MTILEAIWSVIRVPAVIFKGVVRVCAAFGVVVRVVSTATSVVFRPYMFAASLVTRMSIACRSGYNRAITKANKLMKMVIILSFAILVVVVTYLYYVQLHINREP